MSCPTRARGLKLKEVADLAAELRRAPHGHVDWNYSRVEPLIFNQVVPHTGTWIETDNVANQLALLGRAPHGHVDWNYIF